MTYTTFYKALLGTAAVAAMSTGTAFAAGTAAGTNVQNTFTLDYEVGGVTQTQIDNTATPTEFTVDRLVDLTVASNGNTNVVPGAQDQELVFSLTNDGNDTQAYALTTVQGVDGTDDDFDPANQVLFYVIDDGDGIYTPGTDPAPVAYNGTNTPDVAPDATLFVIVQGDIAASQTDGDTGQVALIADTLDAGTTTPTIDDSDVDGLNNLTGTDTILADAAGTDDVASEGDHSAQGTFIVASADVSAGKTVTVFSQDGSDCANFAASAPAGEQYAIPGACVEYRISATNSGTVDATAVAINDQLPIHLEYVDAQVTVFTGGTLTDPAAATDCGPTLGNCTVNLSGATLGTGDTGVVTIRAIIK